MKKTILLLLLLIPVFLLSQPISCPDSIGGWVYPIYTGSPTNNYLAAPKFNAFSVVDTCIVKCFALYVANYTGNRTDDSVMFWLSADTVISGHHQPAHLIAAAWEFHYNWTLVGQNANHYFDVDSIFTNFGESGNLSPQDTLWIGCWTEPFGTNEIWIIRGQASYPRCPTSKASPGTNWTWGCYYFPRWNDFEIFYGPNYWDDSCMGHSIWGILLQEGNTSPLRPTNLIIGN